MVWLFTIGGAILGAVLGKSFVAFLAFGFMGWVVGMIVKAMRSPITPPANAGPPKAIPTAPYPSLSVRLDAIEARLAKVEAALGLEAESVTPVESVETVTPMETVTPVETGAQPGSARARVGFPPSRE